jgi:ABC-type uncharacterized transport system involved in gliding motility auxiliary subunit
VIGVIAGREARALYVSTVAWAWLAAGSGLVAWMVYAQLESFQRLAPRLGLVDGAPGLTDFVALPGVQTAGLVGLLLAPLVGMRLFSEELRTGRIALLLSAPVSLTRLVLGKFLGAMSLFVALWGFVALLVASLALGAPLDGGKLAVGLLGLLLLYGACVAAALWISTLSSQPAAVAAMACGLLLLLWVLAQAAGPDSALRLLSLGFRFERLLGGVLYAEDIAYFLVLIAAFLALAVLRLEGLRASAPSGALRWIPWSLALLILVAAGLGLRLAHRYGGAWDCSAAARHSLSLQSQAVMDRLSGPLRFTAIVPDYGALRPPVEALLQRYQRAGAEVMVAFVDPDTHPEQARRLGVRGPAEVLVEYRGRTERVGAPSERTVTAALQRIALEGERWVVGVAGHGEADLVGRANHDLGEFGAALERTGFRPQPVETATAGGIPDNAALVVLAAPQVALLPGEQALLAAHIAQGGNLLWLLGRESAQDPAALVQALGLVRLPGVIVDAAAATVGADDPTIAVVSRYSDEAAVRGLGVLSLFPGAAALEVVPPPGWRAAPLLQTGPQSWNETGSLRGQLRVDAAAGERRGPLTLGWTLSRPREGGGEQRVVLVGDADFLSNAFLGNAGNLDLGTNLVRWLTENDATLDIPLRAAPDLRYDPPSSAGALPVLFLYGLPLGCLAAGLGIRSWRRTL